MAIQEHPTEREVTAATPATATNVSQIKPAGVARIEVLSRVISWPERLFLFFAVFAVSYGYSLDNTCRNAYQPYALSSFGEHSLLSTVVVLGTVIGAVLQPISAKLSDIFGRVELVGLALVFYTVGTIVVATSKNLPTFSGGVVIWEMGHTSVLFIMQILIADFSSTRWRVMFSFVPGLPTIINTWVSGTITSTVLKHIGWQWGIGMWGIIIPVATLPIFVSFYIVGRRAKKQSVVYAEHVHANMAAARRRPLLFLVELFWLLDVIGIVLLVALLALTLVPFTLAGGVKRTWQQPHIIAPLVVGVLCIPVFVLWELRAPKPLVPFPLLKKRAVWAPICMGIFQNCTFLLVGTYLFTVLQVSFGFSVAAATRVASLYGFTNAVIFPFLGFAVYKARHLKYFVVLGTVLYMAAFGLLIHYRGSATGDGRAGVIAGEVVLGIGGGIFFYAAQATLQVGLKHEHLAAVTGVSLAVHYIGSALGATLSGAIWTQLLPARLEMELAAINSTLAATAFSSPLTAIVPVYPLGTPERTAVIEAYRYIQRILTITAISLSVPLVLLALILPNPELTDAQNLVDGDAELEPEDTKVDDRDDNEENVNKTDTAPKVSEPRDVESTSK